VDKQKKRLKKNDEYMQGLMQGQEKLLEMVRRQDEKNRRLEDHLASGLNVKSLGKNDPRKQAENQYDPLDDISFEDEEQVLAELMQPKRKKKKKPKSDTEEPLMNQMLPMMMMFMNKQQQPKKKHEEYFELLSKQEEKIKNMLEEQNIKKQKELARAKNEALMQRLFQIEEQLLNNMTRDPHKNPIKKVDFTELMKGQQLYQRQLIDTLISINKLPKKREQPTVYLPVPIRDPALLPPLQDEVEPSYAGRRSSAKAAAPSFGDNWASTKTLKPSSPIKIVPKSVSRAPSATSRSRAGVSNMKESVVVNSRQMKSSLPPVQSQPLFLPVGRNEPAPQRPAAGLDPMQGFKPTVLRVYKRRKGDLPVIDSNKIDRNRVNRIPPLRKYGFAVLFCVKFLLGYKKYCMRLRKDSIILFDENISRMQLKVVKSLRMNLSEVLEKIWGLTVPLSLTRRKKLYALYDVDVNTVSPIHWEKTNELCLELLEKLNEIILDEFFDPDVIAFFSRFSGEKACLKEDYFFESMIDRLEFNKYLVTM